MMRAFLIGVMCTTLLATGTVTFNPAPAHAAEEDANAKCKGKKDGTPVEAQGGRVKGTCQKGQFKAESSDGKAIDAGLQALMQALQGMLGKLGGGGGGGGSGSGSGATPAGATTNPLGNTTNSILNSLLGRSPTTTSDASNNTTQDILDSAFDTSNTQTTVLDGDSTTQDAGQVGTEITTVLTNSETGTTQPGTTTSVQQVPKNETVPVPIVQEVGSTVEQAQNNNSNVRVGADGKSIEVRARTNDGNTEIAGFYGGNSSSAGGVQSAVGRVCSNRPWATNFLARIIRPSFFDSLCARLGFSAAPAGGVTPSAPVDTTKMQRAVQEKVQQAQATSTLGTLRGPGIVCSPSVLRLGKEGLLDFSCGSAKLTAVAGFSASKNTVSSATVKPTADTKYGIQCSDGAVYTCAMQVVNPRLTIWSEPKEVTLGTRSTVYWSATDVFEDTCFVKGPSFLERGARGGAATVPINDPSTFVLSCVAADGATTTASVTVELDL